MPFEHYDHLRDHYIFELADCPYIFSFFFLKLRTFLHFIFQFGHISRFMIFLHASHLLFFGLNLAKSDLL